MIFLWVGFVFLAYWSFKNAIQRFGLCFVIVQKSLQVSKDSSFFSFFWRTIAIIFLSGHPLQARMTALALLRTGKWTLRWSLVLLCFSAIGSLIWLGIMGIAFQIAGGFLLISGLLGSMVSRKLPALGQFLWLLFYCGLFFTALENTVRMGGFLSHDESYQDIIFFSADNRIGAMLITLVLSVVVTILGRAQTWSWIFCLIGLSLGILGLNNVVCLVVGESLGWSIVLAAATFKASSGFKKIGQELVAVMLISAILFVLLFGFVRSELNFSGLGQGHISERLEIFILIAASWVFLQTVTLSIWGHWRSRQVWNEKPLPNIPSDWEEQKWILPTFVQSLSAHPMSR